MAQEQIKAVSANEEPTLQHINTEATEYVKGLHGWSVRKKKIINDMADGYKKLIDNKVAVRNDDDSITDYSTYSQQNICALVCDNLEQHNVPATSFGYVRHLLAKRDMTDSSVYQLLQAATKSMDYTEELEEATVQNFDKFDYIPRDAYKKLPLEEKIRVKKQFLHKDKERKMRSRENRTMMDEELKKEGINPDSIKESNIDSPPVNMWGESYTSQQLLRLEEEGRRFVDIVHEMRMLSIKFRPTGKTDQLGGEGIKTMVDGFMKPLNQFWGGYSDQKNRFTYPQWYEKLVSGFESIPEFEISRKALTTGEFATMDDNGQVIVIPLETKITNKHVKDRLEQIELGARKWPIFDMLFKGMELYTRNQVTVIGNDVGEIAKIKEAHNKIRQRDNEYYVREEPRKREEEIEVEA